MKKFYNVSTLLLCTFLGLAGCNQTSIGQTKDDNGQNSNNDDYSGVYYGGPTVWIGPGFYYGVWFSTQLDFNHYNEIHYHHHYHNHHRHDYNRHHHNGESRRSRHNGSGRGSHPHHSGGGGGGHHAPRHGK